MRWLQNFLGNKETAPRVSEGRRVFAVGDIHGRLDLLEILLEKIQAHANAKPAAQNVLIFLGDYIDRGPDSRGVVERLLRLDLKGWQTVFLRGNHEQAILDFVDDPLLYRTWRGYGAPETLLSYGVRPPLFDRDAGFVEARDELARQCPVEHWRFFSRLKFFHVEGDYVFVHAGIRPGLALADQSQKDMLWIREEFLSYRQKFSKMVVHGHTPSPAPVKTANRIGLDTGAHATNCLTAAVFEGEQCLFLDTQGAARTAPHISQPVVRSMPQRAAQTA